VLKQSRWCEQINEAISGHDSIFAFCAFSTKLMATQHSSQFVHPLQKVVDCHTASVLLSALRTEQRQPSSSVENAVTPRREGLVIGCLSAWSPLEPWFYLRIEPLARSACLDTHDSKVSAFLGINAAYHSAISVLLVTYKASCAWMLIRCSVRYHFVAKRGKCVCCVPCHLL